MTCSNCQERGHNKASCKKEAVPPPPKPTRPSKSTTTPDYASYASARGRGRGSRGKRGGSRGSRGGGRGQRGGGRGSRGGGRSQQRNKVKLLILSIAIYFKIVGFIMNKCTLVLGYGRR